MKKIIHDETCPALCRKHIIRYLTPGPINGWDTDAEEFTHSPDTVEKVECKAGHSSHACPDPPTCTAAAELRELVEAADRVALGPDPITTDMYGRLRLAMTPFREQETLAGRIDQAHRDEFARRFIEECARR